MRPAQHAPELVSKAACRTRLPGGAGATSGPQVRFPNECGEEGAVQRASALGGRRRWRSSVKATACSIARICSDDRAVL